MKSEFDEIRKKIRRGANNPNATEEEIALSRMWEGYKRQMWENDPANPNRKPSSDKPTKRSWDPPDWD